LLIGTKTGLTGDIFFGKFILAHQFCVYYAHTHILPFIDKNFLFMTTMGTDVTPVESKLRDLEQPEDEAAAALSS